MLYQWSFLPAKIHSTLAFPLVRLLLSSCDPSFGYFPQNKSMAPYLDRRRNSGGACFVADKLLFPFLLFARQISLPFYAPVSRKVLQTNKFAHIGDTSVPGQDCGDHLPYILPVAVPPLWDCFRTVPLLDFFCDTVLFPR